MIAIVDYGAGNLVSVKKALDWLGQDCAITSDPAEVRRARKIVLPGVGHFASTASLAKSGLQDRHLRSHHAESSLPRHLRRHAMDVLRQRRIARNPRPGPVCRHLRPVSRNREISPRWLEPTRDRRNLSSVPWIAAISLRLLHALLSRAAQRHNGCKLRVRREILGGDRARSFIRRAVSPGKVRRDRTEAARQLLRDLTSKTC